jgi:hypothetical protein
LTTIAYEPFDGGTTYVFFDSHDYNANWILLFAGAQYPIALSPSMVLGLAAGPNFIHVFSSHDDSYFKSHSAWGAGIAAKLKYTFNSSMALSCSCMVTWDPFVTGDFLADENAKDESVISVTPTLGFVYSI